MKKDTHKIGNDAQWEPSCLPRSATSSSLSGRALTPVLSKIGIQGTALRPVSVLSRVAPARPRKPDKLDHIIKEPQHRTQRRRKYHQRSCLHISSSESHVPTHNGNKNVDGKGEIDTLVKILEAEKMAEIARIRAAFSRRRGLLPGIGHNDLGINHAAGKLPTIYEPRAGSQNHVIEIINRHEPDVRVRAALKEISSNVMKNFVGTIFYRARGRITKGGV